jgi:hypothetical protein
MLFQKPRIYIGIFLVGHENHGHNNVLVKTSQGIDIQIISSP